MSRYVLISFIGSHDLTPGKNGAVEQLINYLKPRKTYLFLTDDYKKEFYQNNLKEYYNSLLTEELEIIDTDIKNPTDFEEIAKNISDKTEEINNYILENKLAGFLNLTSGTPAILSVLSLFAITGQLNRTMGLYAPNPQYDNKIKTNSLDYYKNSFAYKTVKKLINTCNYSAVESFLKTEKNILPKLEGNIEFTELVNFAKNRANCAFDEAYKISEKSEYLKKYNYNPPRNLFEKSVECLMSARISEMNKDYFQTVLKLGIIRENLVSFLLDKILNSKGYNIIETKQCQNRKEEDCIRFLSENKLNEQCPQIKEYLENKMQSSDSANKKIDYDRELNSFLEGMILEYFLTQDEFAKYPIQKELYKLEGLKKQRNELAHTINAPKYNINWQKSIEAIINLTAQYLGYNQQDLNVYKEINTDLLKILKKALN